MRTNNIVYYLVLILFFLACYSDKEAELKKLIDSILPYPIQEGTVIVISEYDCVECLNILQPRLKKKNTEKEIYGIFYHAKPFYRKEFSDFMKHTSIQWSRVRDGYLMSLLAKISKKANRPYIVEISDNQIIRIMVSYLI
ncbi:MAG: hypothetical protein OHK0057_32200 [Thermoflexibacter sp.]